MTVCEFCRHFQEQKCQLGLDTPKTMSCREFAPSIQQFCANPKDFVDRAQIVQMARFFGFQRTELKKIQLMATDEESSREKKQQESAELNKFSEATASSIG
jgi:hypothetical protein